MAGERGRGTGALGRVSSPAGGVTHRLTRGLQAPCPGGATGVGSGGSPF